MWLLCSNWEGQALWGSPCSSVGEKMVAAFLVSAAYLLHKVLSLRKAQVTDLETIPSCQQASRCWAGMEEEVFHIAEGSLAPGNLIVTQGCKNRLEEKSMGFSDLRVHMTRHLG